MSFGLALSAAGHAILGPSGIAAISGNSDSKLVQYGVVFGFWMNVTGLFIQTLYSKSPKPETESNT